jgi:hypothetical protein
MIAGFLTSDRVHLPSAEGRYHMCFWDFCWAKDIIDARPVHGEEQGIGVAGSVGAGTGEELHSRLAKDSQ